MTPDALIALALTLPEAEESGHHHMRDARVKGKVFVTYDCKSDEGGFKLLPEQQAMLMETSAAFYPANGVWGERGWTKAAMSAAADTDLESAARMAWANVAPKRLVNARRN